LKNYLRLHRRLKLRQKEKPKRKKAENERARQKRKGRNNETKGANMYKHLPVIIIDTFYVIVSKKAYS